MQLTYKNKKIALKFSWSDSYAYYVFKWICISALLFPDFKFYLFIFLALYLSLTNPEIVSWNSLFT